MCYLTCQAQKRAVLSVFIWYLITIIIIISCCLLLRIFNSQSHFQTPCKYSYTYSSSLSSMVTLDHFWKCMLNSLRNVKFITMWKLTMLITAVCVLFFIKLQWPKNKSLYHHHLSAAKQSTTSFLHRWWSSSVHIDIVFAWLSFRKIYVLKASFSKTFLQITDINCLPTIS